MAETATIQPVTTVSATAARVAVVAAATFLALLAALHAIKPEFDPSWRFISEYAIGDLGWIMASAFLIRTCLCRALPGDQVASSDHRRPHRARLLLVSAAGLAIAAGFTTDPITAGKDALTTSGKLHNLGGTLGIAMPIAAALVSWSLARNPIWFSARRAVLWTAGLAVAGFLVSSVSSRTMLSQHG